jgi:hypothetical protein
VRDRPQAEVATRCALRQRCLDQEQIGEQGDDERPDQSRSLYFGSTLPSEAGTGSAGDA